MARRHAGHFREKHPTDISVDPAVEAAVSSNLNKNQISCAAAFAITEKLSVTPMAVGIAIDFQEGRIVGCQLGLFGYGKNEKLLDAPQDIGDNVKTIIQASLTHDRLSCQKAWEIADAHAIPRLEIARLCESMGIRLCECQLGAFK